MPSKVTTTEQLTNWEGSFGDAYVERNAPTPERVRARMRWLAGILECMRGDLPKSILEVGANIGLNLRALRHLTDAELYAVEPNEKALSILLRDAVLPADHIKRSQAAALDWPNDAVDFVFCSGVLIHIHPDNLLAACREMHRVARRHLACSEYFSDRAEVVHYRGHDNMLFKRDFGSFWLDNFPDLRIVDYGFSWRRTTGLDNPTWWLFEKTRAA